MSPEVHQVQGRERPPFAQAEGQPCPGRARDASRCRSCRTVAHDPLRLEQTADGGGEPGEITIIDCLEIHVPPLAEDCPVFMQDGGVRSAVQAQAMDFGGGIQQPGQRRKPGVHAKVHPAPLLQGADQPFALYQIAEASRL